MKSIILIIGLFTVVGICMFCPLTGLGQYMMDEQSQIKGGFNADYIIQFTEQHGKSRLRIFASVVYDDMQFLKEDNKFRAEYRITFTVMDSAGVFVSSNRIDRTVLLEEYLLTNSREEYDWVDTEFELAPGKYKVMLELMDKDSRETKRLEEKIVINDLSVKELAILGPILLDTIIVDEVGGIKLRPGLSGEIFDGQKPIWVYFEVYSAKYPVELNIKYNVIDSDGKERISGDFTRLVETEVLRYKFRLDIDEFPFDNYQLVLIVSRDKESARQTKHFRIHWPELPPIIQDLETAIEQLIYIASEREIARLKENYLGRRLEMFLKFWSEWGKDEAESYKLMEEYFWRIREAETAFSEGGWRSDRGHVYVIYGPPSEIDRHPYDLYSKAYEIWYYYENNIRFIFVDEGGFGDYRLQSPLWQN